MAGQTDLVGASANDLTPSREAGALCLAATTLDRLLQAGGYGLLRLQTSSCQTSLHDDVLHWFLKRLLVHSFFSEGKKKNYVFGRKPMIVTKL